MLQLDIESWRSQIYFVILAVWEAMCSREKYYRAYGEPMFYFSNLILCVSIHTPCILVGRRSMKHEMGKCIGDADVSRREEG